jgi:hypothetical protein
MMLLLLSPSLKLGIIEKAECLEFDCSLRLNEEDRERLRESGAGIAASMFRLNPGFAWKVTGTTLTISEVSCGLFSVLAGTATLMLVSGSDELS